ncbi:MAG: ABC transporter substrate-binding protein [Bdellovibrionales bacterium]
MSRFFALLAALGTASVVSAAIPKMSIKVLGKPEAPVAGTLYRNLSSEPESLHPLRIDEVVTQLISEYVMEGLLWWNPDTAKFEPQLAESYEVSKDFLTYTFHLDKSAHFGDGSPVTAEDVKFSIEAVRDPAFKAANRIPYYEDIESITTPDAQTVIFKMKRVYFKNLEVLASMGFTPIVSKKIYQDPNKKFDGNSMFGSGPYKIEAYNRGKNIILARDENYWGKDKPNLKAFGKFKNINFRFIKEENLEIEMVKKGDIDFMWPIQIENFEKKAQGAPFGTTIRKVKAENKKPKRYGYIGWNFKNPMFQDRDTRVALSHLFNRQELIKKFMFGMAVEGRAPVYYKSPFMPGDVKPIEYSVSKARALLTKSGWKDEDKNGVLEKTIDGQTKEFRFTLVLANKDVEKYFTLYKEDLKKAGIDMSIKIVEWNTLMKLMDEQKFEAITLAWGGGSPEDDLKQIWHSDSNKPGGSNFISYSNKEVDKYIEAARQEMNESKRKVLWQKAVRLIAQDAPYTYLFNLKYDLYLLNSRIDYDRPTYTYDLSHLYWYMSK